jgi:DNA-directed RNA polymerase sigma subunit (sigma70/sigma32)
VQVIAEAEMAELIRSCLAALDELEAEYIRDRFLLEPSVPLAVFAEQWGLSRKALGEIEERALLRLKRLLATRHIDSMADIV